MQSGRLVIDRVSFGYRGRPLLREFCLELKPGELVQVVGPNGAGKSTLLAIVAGLLQAQSGEVTWHGEAGAIDDRRDALEFLPAEANGLLTKADAMTNLSFWTKLRGRNLGEADLVAALGRWQLDQPLLRSHFPIEKFSTGMKRRLALARLELADCPCWILDEPIYGLDHAAVAAFRDLLEAHLKRGGCALAVSHESAPLAGLVTEQRNLGESA